LVDARLEARQLGTHIASGAEHELALLCVGVVERAST
jgi:hypothetical protein